MYQAAPRAYQVFFPQRLWAKDAPKNDHSKRPRLAIRTILEIPGTARVACTALTTRKAAQKRRIQGLFPLILFFVKKPCYNI